MNHYQTKAPKALVALILTFLMFFSLISPFAFADQTSFIQTSTDDSASSEQEAFEEAAEDEVLTLLLPSDKESLEENLSLNENQNEIAESDSAGLNTPAQSQESSGPAQIPTDEPETVDEEENVKIAFSLSSNEAAQTGNESSYTPQGDSKGESENSIPVINPEAINPMEASVEVNKPFTLMLNTIFLDLDTDDTLTYTLSIDGADKIAAEGSFSYTPEKTGSINLSFYATDGKDECAESYKVNLSVSAPEYEQLYNQTHQAYLVGNVKELKIFRNAMEKGFDFSGKNVYLTSDIALNKDADIGYLGNVPLDAERVVFNGNFDGRGHVISDWSDGNALFFTIGEKGKVKNIYMKDINLTGPAMCAPIAFYNYGEISKITVDGSISGSQTGYCGIVYGNISGGIIKDCLVSVTIDSTKSSTSATACGLTANNSSGTVKNCVFTGSLSIKKGKLYPIAAKGTIENCYYLENSKYKSASGASSLSSIQLTQKESFSDFDFEDTWSIGAAESIKLKYSFGELKYIPKIPVKITAAVGDYTYTKEIEQKNCVFPLSLTLSYAGSDQQIAQDFSSISSTYECRAELRSEKWKSSFAVKIPVDGISQDFSALNLSAFYDFTYKQNEEYEFIVTEAEYSDSSATFYNDKTISCVKTSDEKQALVENAEKAVIQILDLIAARYGDKCMENPFFDFTCARAGYYPSGTDSDKMFVSLKKVWDEYASYQSSKGKKPETTETAKFILAITAIGYDARDFDGIDMISVLNTSDNAGKYFAVHYAAYALYSGGYGDYKALSQSLVSALIENPKDGSYNADDMATMYAQPIFLFYNKNAEEKDEQAYKIKKYTEEQIIPWIQRSQTAYGHFYSTFTSSTVNVWTDAQAQLLIALLSQDPFSESYVKNGNSLIDYICENPSLSLGYQGDESQCARALNALVRAYKKQNNIFDCSDTPGVLMLNKKISALPDEYSESAKEQMDIILSDYAKLTPEKQKYVDLSKLECLTADLLIKMIENINLPIALESEGEIQAAIEAYNLLTGSEKQYVIDSGKLNSLNDMLNALTLLKAKECDRLIALIPSSIKLSDEAVIVAARTYYSSLTTSQAAKVEQLSRLTAAEEALGKLKEAEKPGGSTKSVTVTIDKITYKVSAATKKAYDAIQALLMRESLEGEILNINDSDYSSVLAAYRLYDKLTSDEKLFVNNFSDFSDLLNKIALLNHKDEQSGIDLSSTKSETLPWNVRLVANTKLIGEDEKAFMKKALGESADLYSLYEISFIDTLNGQKVNPEGTLSFTLDYSEQLPDGLTLLAFGYEQDEPKIIAAYYENGKLSFECEQLSQVGAAGFIGTWEDVFAPETSRQRISFAPISLILILILIGVGGVIVLLVLSNKRKKEQESLTDNYNDSE